MRNILRGTWLEVHKSVSFQIITACLTVFSFAGVLDLLGLIGRQQSLAILGLSYRGLVLHSRFFQFVTAPFVHGNLTHLAFNMLTLWMLGPDIEILLGRRRYVAFSIVCAASSMIGFLIWNWGRPTIGLGYSGVIFGILVAQARFFSERKVYIYAFFPLRMKYAVLVLSAIELWLLVLPERAGVGHIAHLFGALGGWLYLRTSKVPRASQTKIFSATPLSNLSLGMRQDDQNEIPREL